MINNDDAKNEDKLIEFLYPGDVWEALLGKEFENKLENFIHYSVQKGMVQSTKIIYNNVYSFLGYRPDNSKIGFISIIQHLKDKKENIYTVGFPFFEGVENEFLLQQIKGHKDHYKLEGYNLLDFGNNSCSMWMYNPLFGQQRSLLQRMCVKSIEENVKIKFCVAGLGFQIEHTPETKFKIDKGGMYEVALEDFLKNNPDKTKEDFPFIEVDASHTSGLFPSSTCADAYEFMADISKVEEFKFYNTDFYCLEIEPMRDPDTENLKVNLYVNKNELNDYVPKIGDNIRGLMQLIAYISNNEMARLENSLKTKVEFITQTKRIEYEVEEPFNDDDFATGLAFRENMPEQTGMFYKYGNSETVCMWTPQTLIPLDMIFTDNCGNIIKIARNTKPLSTERHLCNNVAAVLEINGGECDRLGIKEGDILLHSSLVPNYNYGKMTIKNAEEYYRYDNDLYAVKDGSLHFYSLKSHQWYCVDNESTKKTIDNRVKSYEIQGIKKIIISEHEVKKLQIKYENDLRKDYAKTSKRYYRLRGCLFYSHDEINNNYQLYLYEKGWVDVNWLIDSYQLINQFRDLAMKVTSSEIEKLIEEYKKRSDDHNKREDEINLTHLGYYEKESSKDKFYLVLGGTLWRINEETQTYQTYSSQSNSWDNMDWLNDELEHEVECAKTMGEKLSYEEAIKIKDNLRSKYIKRISSI